MSSEGSSQPSISKVNFEVEPSSIKTNENLHILVRSYCAEHRISQQKLSGDYRCGVEQCLKDLLNVTTLTSEQNKIVKLFCDQVPSFYRKWKSNVVDVRRKHKDFFEKVISCTANVSFDDVPNTDVPNTDIPNTE